MNLHKEGLEILRTRISIFIVKNPDNEYSKIVNHFLQEGYVCTKIYNNINKVLEGRAFNDK